jgi:hypothetical protein
VCISYDIPKTETHGKKKLFRKGKLGRGRNRSLGRFLATVHSGAPSAGACRRIIFLPRNPAGFCSMINRCRQTSAELIRLLSMLMWVACRRLQVGPLTSLTTPSVSKYLSPLTFSCNFDHSSYSNDMSSLKCIQQ